MQVRVFSRSDLKIYHSVHVSSWASVLYFQCSQEWIVRLCLLLHLLRRIAHRITHTTYNHINQTNYVSRPNHLTLALDAQVKLKKCLIVFLFH